MARTFTKQPTSVRPVTAGTKKNACPIYGELVDAIYNKVNDEFLDNIAIVIGSEVPEYDPDWIADGFNAHETMLDDAQMKFARALADYLTANYRQ